MLFGSMPDVFPSDEPFVISFPALVKASPNSAGRRLIAVEASNQNVDLEGDCVLQSALLQAAGEFLRSGVIDVDHVSEIGGRYGVRNPTDWIVGVPTEVNDIGKGRTEVVAELHQPQPGIVSKADEIWENLNRNPPVRWRASIYGFPNGSSGFVDARITKCPEAPDAKRYVVKSLIWKSLALTRNPINDAITGAATIITAKAFIKSLQVTGILGQLTESMPELAKDASPAMMPGIESMLPPRNRMELLAHHTLHIDKGKCPFAGQSAPLGKSVASFRSHFSGCCGVPAGTDDILALALMQALKHEKSW